MSNNDENSEISLGCELFSLILALIIIFAFLLIITKIIIWICSGLFNIDLSDRYWYVFWAWILLYILITANRE